MLVVFRGLPGTGKSTLAAATAQKLGATWLRVDVFEAGMLKAGLERSFETGLAAYIVAEDVAADHLRLGQDVVVDAVNARAEDRTVWQRLAERFEADLYVVETVCSDREAHRGRVERRGSPTPPLPALTWTEVIQRNMDRWGPPALILDTVHPTEACMAGIEVFLSNPNSRVPARAHGGRGATSGDSTDPPERRTK